MASTGKKWGIGCGIGCLAILLIGGGLGGVAFVSVKKIVDQAETMEDTFAAMDSTFGKPNEFVPGADGRIPADRIEAFLAAHEAVGPQRDEAAGMVLLLDGKDPSGPVSAFQKVKATFSLIPSMLHYLDVRNQALMERGMGLGEFQYIYALAYFSYLHKDPGDGPSFQMSGPDENGDGGNVRWGVHVDSDGGDTRERRARQMRRMMNRNLGDMARNQLEELDRQLAAGADPALAVWRDQLAAEVEKMREEPLRVLWEEDLPEPLLESFEPYRVQLDAAFVSVLNVVEMGLVDHE